MPLPENVTVVACDSQYAPCCHPHPLMPAPVLSTARFTSSADVVSQGFSVPWNNLFVQFFTLLGFMIPLCLFAHYILKGREVAA